MHGIKQEYFTFQLDKICKPGNTLIIGDRETGKTSICNEIIDKVIKSDIGNNIIVYTLDPRDYLFYCKKIGKNNVYNNFNSLKYQIEKHLKNTDIENQRKLCVIVDGFKETPRVFFSREIINYIYLNGRNNRIMNILTMQSLERIPPRFREQHDNVFLTSNKSIDNIKNVYDCCAGMYPTFETFYDAFNKLTNLHNMDCMVLSYGYNKSLKELVYKFHITPLPDIVNNNIEQDIISLESDSEFDELSTHETVSDSCQEFIFTGVYNNNTEHKPVTGFPKNHCDARAPSQAHPFRDGTNTRSSFDNTSLDVDIIDTLSNVKSNNSISSESTHTEFDISVDHKYDYFDIGDIRENTRKISDSIVYNKVSTDNNHCPESLLPTVQLNTNLRYELARSVTDEQHLTKQSQPSLPPSPIILEINQEQMPKLFEFEKFEKLENEILPFICCEFTNAIDIITDMAIYGYHKISTEARNIMCNVKNKVNILINN